MTTLAELACLLFVLSSTPALGYFGGFGPFGGFGLGLYAGYPGFGFPWLAPPLGFQINSGSIYGAPGIGFRPRRPDDDGGPDARSAPAPDAKAPAPDAKAEAAAGPVVNSKGSETAASQPGKAAATGSADAKSEEPAKAPAAAEKKADAPPAAKLGVIPDSALSALGKSIGGGAGGKSLADAAKA